MKRIKEIKTIIELKPTYACTQNCSFCCFDKLKPATMSQREIEKVLEYIKREHKLVDIFILSGGEPTILNSFWKVLDCIKNDIRPKKLVIHSNGLFFCKQENVEKIKKYSPILMISFHTMTRSFYHRFICELPRVSP